ncbi:MAG: hypothetical protein NT027_14615 [Proteobacteria bacterium]|nr:hypothetical protein [Pseudomonadota bacterium]
MQLNTIEAPQIGEVLLVKCLKDRAEILQWTSFALAIHGQNDRSKNIDRLLMPKPKGSGVKRTLEMAEAGSYQKLQERLQNFHPQYKKRLDANLTLGRALARAQDFEKARREMFTYVAQKPNDQAARIEYLYLAVWAKTGNEAVKGFQTALDQNPTGELRESILRGLDLCYGLWPELAPKASAPSPSVAMVTEVKPTVVKPEAAVTAPIVNKSENEPDAKKDVLSDKDESIVNASFLDRKIRSLSQVNRFEIATTHLGVNPLFAMNKIENLNFGEKPYETFQFQGQRLWKLSPELSLDGSAGVYLSDKTQMGLAHFEFQFDLKGSGLILNAGMDRSALSDSVVLAKIDAGVSRDSILASVDWNDMVSWSGSLFREQNVLMGETHQGLIKWDHSIECTKSRCLSLFVPFGFERNQTVSPYYYSDADRWHFGFGASHRQIVSGSFGLKVAGEWKRLQALLPSGLNESYSSIYWHLGADYVYDAIKFGLLVKSNQVNSEYQFRKPENYNDVLLQASLMR